MLQVAYISQTLAGMQHPLHSHVSDPPSQAASPQSSLHGSRYLQLHMLKYVTTGGRPCRQALKRGQSLLVLLKNKLTTTKARVLLHLHMPPNKQGSRTKVLPLGLQRLSLL